MAGENQSVNDLARKVWLRGMTAADADGDQTDATDNAAGSGILVTTVSGGSGGAVTITDGTDTMLVTTAGAASTDLTSIAGNAASAGSGIVGTGTQRMVLGAPATALLLSAVTTGGLGGVVDLGQAYSKFTMQVTASDGSATSTDLLCLLGSIDGGEFFIMTQTAAGLDTEFNTVGGGGSNARGYASASNFAVRYVRAGIGTVADGHFTATATAVGGTATFTAQVAATAS